ncbi:hypothetical protein F2P81_026416 [Scophthalmus maximus]|uniref:Uncharacterized protein n=1 Tax=Scophthalmus maximus TaxID=52904 RepID=A0A6A4RPQ4_SCOMX|nr:hypothetical protein F2P81_026416 [Scophthalmus maximus]
MDGHTHAKHKDVKSIASPSPPGLIPYNFICVRTGSMLSEISSADDVFSWGTLGQLLAIALAALVPGALIKSHGRRRLKVDGMERNGSGHAGLRRDRRRR